MGVWARLTALVAVAGTGLAVVSGAAGWGTAHRVLAAVALPPLAALAATAWVSSRRLLVPIKDALTPVPATGAPFVVYGGHRLAHAP